MHTQVIDEPEPEPEKDDNRFSTPRRKNYSVAAVLAGIRWMWTDARSAILDCYYCCCCLTKKDHPEVEDIIFGSDADSSTGAYNILDDDEEGEFSILDSSRPGIIPARYFPTDEAANEYANMLVEAAESESSKRKSPESEMTDRSSEGGDSI